MLNETVQSPQISRLPREVIEKIAAGEVIERPANLVKELIENSLDAGAHNIEIDFSDGGRSLRILDDGAGIPKAELPLALERHATSKIRRAEDLWILNSFGFRGEALASISAVARLQIISRTPQSEQAWKIECHFGQASEVDKVSHGVGTEIRVSDLFENVPARLKFLKSEAAEYTQIKKVIKAFALAWPKVGFKIRQKNELVAFWPGVDQEKRVEQVLGVKLNCIEKHVRGVNLRLSYSSPVDVERTAQNIWIFVQRRWVQDKSIQAAIMESYRNLLMHGEYPIVVADVQVPTDEVDVNIHPAKSQVKFLNPSGIYSAVHGTLRTALEASVPKTPVPEQTVTSEPENLHLLSTQWGQVHFRKKLSHQEVLENRAEPPPADASIPSVQESDSAPQGFWSSLQVLGQSHLTYILTQSRKSLFLVDQHAAHERIVFEKLMTSYKKAQLEVQNYLLPLVLNFEADMAEALLSLREPLERIGLGLDSMGPETLAVRSAPALLKESAVEKVLFKLGKEKLETGESFALENVLGDIFATMACHSVVRAGQSLSHEEMKSLLSQMDEFPFSSFCPHGRPVYIEWAFSEIEREFGRIL